MRADPFVKDGGDGFGSGGAGVDSDRRRLGGQEMAGVRHKPTVLVINTGGTLGMRKDSSGGLAPVPGYFTSQMLQMEDLATADDMPFFDIVEYDPLLDSSCFQPSDWVQIAVDIGRAYQHYDGFVVCMGTDTMAYAASALSFMLENLGKTVVFTGSQIPLAEVYNDARRNVIVAITIAGNQEIPEVCLFFCDRLLRANRAVKVDSLALAAYDSPNFPPLGQLGVTMRYRRDIILAPPRGPFRVHTKMDSRVVVVKLVPGFDDDVLKALVEHCTALRAVVLELYGTGNSPSRREDFVQFVKGAKAKGILVVAVTQCLRGGVSLSTYAVGVALERNGVLSGGDMTTEAVVTKLAYLFGLTNNPEVPVFALYTMRHPTTYDARYPRRAVSFKQLPTPALRRTRKGRRRAWASGGLTRPPLYGISPRDRRWTGVEVVAADRSPEADADRGYSTADGMDAALIHSTIDPIPPPNSVLARMGGASGTVRENGGIVVVVSA
eukprot:g19154.t2